MVSSMLDLQKKMTEAVGSSYWCKSCHKNEETCSLRFIMVVKVSDPSGSALLSVFNDQAEQIIGCTADKLDRIKSELAQGQAMAPSLMSDGKTIDQGIAYVLMLVALLVTYLVH